MVVCVDDVLIAAKQQHQINNLLQSLKKGTNMDTGQRESHLKTFDFTDDGNVKTFLGTNVEKIGKIASTLANLI